MTWEEMKVKYPEDRSDMSEEREKEFVEDCFSCYESEGFAKKFWTPFESHRKRKGQTFEVVRRLTEEDCDLCILPMWNIKFEDGIVTGAYPEEIIPREMRANGCPWTNIEQR